MKLNGWRRFGVLLSSVWLIGVIAWAVLEVAKPQFTGTFAYMTMDEMKGMVMNGNKVTLANGKIIRLKTARDPNTGTSLKPWEIDWESEPDIPKETNIRWLKLVTVALVLPALTWALIELLTVGFSWVWRGFKSNK
jgi:hypothetical protein